MEDKKTLYQKLHCIQKGVKGLSKDKDGHNYKYVAGNKVLSFIKPLMEQHGLLLKQEVLSIDNERMDYKTKYAEKSEILSKVMMRFTWIDVESGETDVNMFGANGQNEWEKGLGSALTYAERYFLLKYFHIATDEDDIDNPDRKPEPKEQPKKTTKKQPNKPTKKGTKLGDKGFEYYKTKGSVIELTTVLESRDLTEAQRTELENTLTVLKQAEK